MTSLDQEIIIPNGKLLEISNQYCGLFYLLKTWKRDFIWYFTKNNWNYLNTILLDNSNNYTIGDIYGENLPNEFTKYMYKDLKEKVFKTISVEDVICYFEDKANLDWDKEEEEEKWDFGSNIDFFLMNELIDNLLETTILNKPYGIYKRDELYNFLKKKLASTLEYTKNGELLLEYKFYSIPYYTAF
mgnify:CR=1 FL=1|uniref:Uncharacterized protein n=1 Tax=viral metagenome TaxID=1070528 RepID=A0A6C0JAU7_9ZZZZ